MLWQKIITYEFCFHWYLIHIYKFAYLWNIALIISFSFFSPYLVLLLTLKKIWPYYPCYTIWAWFSGAITHAIPFGLDFLARLLTLYHLGLIQMFPHFSQLVTKISVFYYFTNCNVSSDFNENDYDYHHFKFSIYYKRIVISRLFRRTHSCFILTILRRSLPPLHA